MLIHFVTYKISRKHCESCHGQHSDTTSQLANHNIMVFIPTMFLQITNSETFQLENQITKNIKHISTYASMKYLQMIRASDEEKSS